MKILVTLLLAAFYLLSQVSTGQSFEADPPNIIFILIDDQRYDFLSHLEHPWIKTPNIDRLAANSLYFSNAFVTTSLCSPSRASIITGMYAHSHQVIDNETPLPRNLPMFPAELQKAGYKTAFMGKWHMGGSDANPRPGFDHWISFKGQGPYTDPTFNIDGVEVAREGYTPDLLTEYAVKYLNKANDRDGLV
ncbi:MAG: sulfatase-like hydrolase/transferase [Bacteroidota bacterium]